MSLFTIADLHLSLGADKPMDIFSGWDNHVERLKKNWIENVTDSDTVVIIGDISWGMSLANSLEDFKFIENLPGRKIIVKGNHDFWWTTKNKMDNFFLENGLNTLNLLHNNYYEYDGIGICGTRGWVNDNSEPANQKVILREAGRLEASITSAEKAGLKPIVFLHYPPVYGMNFNVYILDIMLKHKIKYCFYGHLHGKAHAYAINGERDGIIYQLVSSDYTQFSPINIDNIVQNVNLI